MSWRPSVRTRITAAATAGIAVTLGALALWLGAATTNRQLAQIDDQLRADAVITVRVMRSQPPVPDLGRTGRIVQVYDGDGRLLGANVDGEGRPALLPPTFPWADHPGGTAVSVDDPELGPVRVWTFALDGDGPPWVMVGTSTEQLQQSTQSLRTTLLVVLPLLTLALGALVWIVVGRALRPVERIRATVSEITEQDLSRRVAASGTGDEVDRLARTMNEMLDRLERAAESERRLVADASHELRSPLAAAQALIESRPPDGDEGRRHDAMALDALARLRALVDQLLELARHDRPDAPPSRPVDLDELVLQHADVVRRTRSLQVDTSLVSGGQVVGSAEALARMIENLASNAARHARSTVRFSLAERDGRVELVVADDGPGIPPEHRRAVFGRFARLDDGRARDGSGTGLGLAIVARIVERHGGTVRAEAGPDGEGATIVVDLPSTS